MIGEEIEKPRDQGLEKGNVAVGVKENNANEKEEIENVRKGKESENEKEKENVEMKKDVESVKEKENMKEVYEYYLVCTYSVINKQ